MVTDAYAPKHLIAPRQKKSLTCPRSQAIADNFEQGFLSRVGNKPSEVAFCHARRQVFADANRDGPHERKVVDDDLIARFHSLAFEPLVLRILSFGPDVLPRRLEATGVHWIAVIGLR